MRGRAAAGLLAGVAVVWVGMATPAWGQTVPSPGLVRLVTDAKAADAARVGQAPTTDAAAPVTPAPGPESPAEPKAVEPAPAEPALAPRAAAPNDLHPRPLGVPRDRTLGGVGSGRKPAAAGGTASAASALWDNPLVRTGGSLCIVLGVIFGMAALAKKLAAKNGGLAAALGARRGPAGIIEVLGRYPLSRGQTLVLLKVDQRVLLVAQTAGRLRGGPGSLSTLCELSGPEEVASILMKVQEAEGDSTHARFRHLLDRFEKGHPGAGEGADEGVVEVGLRTRTAGDDGDAAELWDDRPAVVHRFPIVQPTAVRVEGAPHPPPQQAVHAAHAAYAAHGPLAQTGTDSYSSIRERLQALRGEAHR